MSTSSLWGISVVAGADGSFAQNGLSRLVRTCSNQTVDRVTFSAPAAAADGSALFPYRSTVRILRNSVLWFTGLCLTQPRHAQPSAESIDYELAGPWWYLEHCIYQQIWRMWDATATPPALANLEKSRVILLQDDQGHPISTGDQIKAVITYAISKGAPIALGTVDPDIMLPTDERVDITCADVITQMLRFSPDCVAFWDYSTTLPTFHCRKSSNMEPITLSAFGQPASSLAITPRYDLQAPGVVVRFEMVNTNGDDSSPQCIIQSAGVTTDWETIVSTIQLSGSQNTWVSQKIKTDVWPTNEYDATWWKAHDPTLNEACKATDANGAARAHIANLSFYAVTLGQSGRSGALSLPRFLTEGQIQDWMIAAPLDIVQEEETLTVLAEYDIVDAAGNVLCHKKEVETTFKAISTDAVTKTYRQSQDTSSGELIPEHMADKLFDAWGRLYWQGDIQLTEEECGTRLLRPGSVINLVGGLPDWTVMDGIVQQVVEDVDQGITRISFGPPRHLGADDLLELLRGLRTRKVSTHRLSKNSGKATDDQGSTKVDLSGPTPEKAPGKGEGIITKSTVRKDSGGHSEIIKSDPSDITSTSGTTEVKSREVSIFDASTPPVLYKVWAMAAAPTASPLSATQTVITAIRYDTTSHKLQAKTRSIVVIPTADESDWTDIVEFQPCPT